MSRLGAHYAETVIAWWSPRLWGAHLVALVCVGAAVGLGLWQYDAWQDHRAAERVDLTKDDPVPLTEVLGPDQPFPSKHVGRPVTVEGTWLPAGTFTGLRNILYAVEWWLFGGFAVFLWWRFVRDATAARAAPTDPAADDRPVGSAP